MRIIVEPVKTGKKNVIQFEILDEQKSQQKALDYYRKLAVRAQKGRSTKLELDVKLSYRHRTIPQNNLLRALERVIAFENFTDEDRIEPIHEGLVENYCPTTTWVDPFTKAEKSRKKRTSELSTVEMSRVIGGAFRELMRIPGLKRAEDVQHYWIEWNNWRGKQSVDPFTDSYLMAEEYREMVCYCEACLSGLKGEDEMGKEINLGHLAHIVSKGAGGTADLWNLIHLCDECHLQVQHLQGWAKLLRKYPHLVWRVAEARIQAGGKALSEIFDDEEWKPIVDEIGRRRKAS